jgi:ABC-type glycerol-3-phosphate transport system substrate-binding protein
MRARNDRSLKLLGGGLAVAGVLGAYLISVLHVDRTAFSSGDALLSEETVIRIAHNLNDSRVQDAFSHLAREYQQLHPGVRIEIQSIPQRAYDQWATTQLMGGTPPALVQMMGRAGI